MSQWPSTKAAQVLAALLRIGWQIKRQSGSHRTRSRQGWPDFVFAFHDREATESARGLLQRIDELRLETTGRFLHRNGDVLPW